MKRHETVEIPASKIKVAIADILKKEGFIRDFHAQEWKGQGKIVLHLKYRGKRQSVIQGLRRISSPGRRTYQGYKDIKPVYHGTGISIYSTPKGVLTDQAAREMKVGGELLVNIW